MRLRKFLLWGMVVAICLISLQVSVFAEEQEIIIGGEVYHKVSSVEEFESMHGENNYILTSDIDFSGKIYTRYVVPAHFHGVLDGNGFSLLGIRLESDEIGAGIFNMAYLTDESGSVLQEPQIEITTDENGEEMKNEVMVDAVAKGFTYTIKNLTIGAEGNRAKISSTQAYLGTIAGWVHENSVLNLTNVNVYADVSGVEQQQCGGFFGRVAPQRLVQTSTLTACAFYGSVHSTGSNVAAFIGLSISPIKFVNCCNYGDISSDTNNVGGFVGTQNPVKYCGLTFERCSNKGEISGVNCVGGFVGKGQYSQIYTDCINDGEISARGRHVGGFAAYENNTTNYIVGVTLKFVRCKNNATVSSTDVNTHIGGFIGTAYDHVSISDCENNGDVINGKFAGGILGYFLPNVCTEDFKSGEYFKAEITKTVNNGNVIASTTQGGSIGGIIGGTVVNGHFFTVNIDSCTNNGRIEKNAENGSECKIGGIIGRFNNDSGILTISNCMNAGVVKGQSEDGVGGILGYTNAQVTAESAGTIPEGVKGCVRRIENCLNIGELICSGLYPWVMGQNYAASGTMVNCYYLETLNVRTYFGTPDMDARSVNEAMLFSGELAQLLGEGFGQQLGVDQYPVVGGNAVLKNSKGELYNAVHDHDFVDQKPTPLNIGSHSRTCVMCEEIISEGHSFGDYMDHGDGKCYHVCTVCGYESIPQTHKMEYTDLMDGTHKGVCSMCNSEIIEAHTFEKGNACKLCDLEKEQTDVSSDVNQDTSADSGCRSVGGFTMLLVMMILTVSYICLKRKEKVCE